MLHQIKVYKYKPVVCSYVVVTVSDCWLLQGRQKLARFNAREFATLIIDILSDARQRQQGSSTGQCTTKYPAKMGQNGIKWNKYRYNFPK